MTTTADASARVEVRKTYKLYIGGAFPRSESGRSYAIYSAKGRTGARFLANAAQGSRKDARDAVAAARGAFVGWAGATAYNRGQVLYRVAEVMEGRFEQFVEEVVASEGLTPARARANVAAAIDRWVWYAGWSDKIAQVLGALNPVAGPYFDISAPEPTGVVVSGNTAVLLSSEQRPLPAITLAEALATSDVPGGVVNVITGRTAEVAPWLASHRDVNAIDLAGAADAFEVDWGDLERACAENLKRVLRPAGTGAAAVEPDWSATPDLGRIKAYLETKTVWHPKGR